MSQVWVGASAQAASGWKRSFERMVPFEEKHLAVMTIDVTVLNADAPVTVSCQMINRQDGEDVYGGTPSAPRRAGFDPRKTEKLPERVLQPQG